MSMLADILSKVHQPGSKREVPPNLKNIVNASAGQSARKKKIIILSAIFVVSLLAGIFFIQYVKALSDTPDINIASISPEAVRQKIRDKQAAASQSSSPLQGSNPGDLDKQNEAQGKVQPAISGEESVGTITEEEALLPKVSSKNEDRIEVLQPMSDKPVEAAPGSAPHQNAGMHDEVKIPDKRVNKINTDNPPAPALHAESADTHGMDAYLYRAREYDMKGDYSKALTNYKRALEMDRGNYAVINNIAYIYLRLNLIDESITYSRMAVDINRDNPAALINLGIAYAKSGDMISAQEYLNKAFMLEPDNQDVVLNLAILHERQDQLQEASEYFSRLIKLGNMNGPLGLARIYEKQGKIDGAIKLYRSIYENDSADGKMKSYARQRMILLNNRK